VGECCFCTHPAHGAGGCDNCRKGRGCNRPPGVARALALHDLKDRILPSRDETDRLTGKRIAPEPAAPKGRGKMTAVDRFCMWCRKPMTRAQRIEMGFSVMHGRQAVCSERCRLLWNTQGRLGMREDDKPTYAELAKECDWGQVVSNGGPPCFYVETDGTKSRFCLRAERWRGHTDKDAWPEHQFVSLADLLSEVQRG
jgi:hypothetical protein